MILDRIQSIYNEADGDLVNAFLKDFLYTYRQLQSSGCFADEITERQRTKIALKITGDNIQLYPNERREYNNARNFV